MNLGTTKKAGFSIGIKQKCGQAISLADFDHFQYTPEPAALSIHPKRAGIWKRAKKPLDSPRAVL